ncbi:MAG: imidazolonepropionase [Gammaproteobacteria bacterium]|nr:imidazolonepropionase [Gammaproteobacteria bacterium]
MPETLFINARIATMADPSGLGLLDNSGLLVHGDTIAWVGPMADCPDSDDAQIIDCGSRLITPGLIDCHTHLVYGGDRADEFEQRLEGLSYSEIAKRGGGIRSTVAATREASEAELLKQAQPRLQQLLDEGVTTVEIKSGYGLDSQNEIKMLRVARQLEEEYSVRVMKTFLGAHALPEEYTDNAEDYISLVCDEMLPQAHAEGLVDAVDVFIESIAFDLPQAQRVFEVAKSLGLPIKAHVEQLSDIGGAMLASEFDALSVDHIEYLAAEDVCGLADKNTVAVLLPGAFYVLRETQLPPINALRAQAVPIAIASDANPGSSPLHSILLTMNMACTLFSLTPNEALRGVTINAAKALGLESSHGSLETGKQADIVIWNLHKPSLLAYQIGINPCAGVMRAGQWRKPFKVSVV